MIFNTRKIKTTIFYFLLLSVFCSSAQSAITVDDVKNNVHVETGFSGCPTCTSVKSYLSGTIKRYSWIDINDGSHLNGDISLGITNKEAALKNFTRTGILGGDATKTLTMDTGNHYRYFISIRHNAKLNSGFLNVFLVKSDGNHELLSPIAFKGERDDKSCFNSGCIWYENYAVSEKNIADALENNFGLTIFVGYLKKEQSPSTDGFKPSEKTIYVGATSIIDPSLVKTYVEVAKSKGEISFEKIMVSD